MGFVSWMVAIFMSALVRLLEMISRARVNL